MKKILFSFLLLSINLFCNAQTTLLKSGTKIIVANQNPLHSDGMEQAYFIIQNDVTGENNTVLIKQGTAVNMNIERKKAGSWGKPGFMSVTALNTTSTDYNISISK